MRHVILAASLLALSLFAGCDGGGDESKTARQAELGHAVVQPSATGPTPNGGSGPAGAGNPPDGSAKEAKEGGEQLFSTERVYAFGAPESASSEETRRAEQAIDFYNRAREMRNQSWFKAPNLLRRNTADYLEEWRIKPPPRLSPGKHFSRNLAAPRGIFTANEERVLTQALDGMDQALNRMIGHYRELDKYARDDAIVDDGAGARSLAAEMEAEHDRFMKARHDWAAIVAARAAAAEKLLLAEHPLRRQILAAGNIFDAISEVSDMLESGSPDKKAIADIAGKLAEQIREGEKPPFAAAPALERLYRGFLKEARQYEIILRRALREGLGNIQQRELLEAAGECASSYNEFAASANAAHR